jgi:hypothetical protein
MKILTWQRLCRHESSIVIESTRVMYRTKVIKLVTIFSKRSFEPREHLILSSCWDQLRKSFGSFLWCLARSQNFFKNPLELIFIFDIDALFTSFRKSLGNRFLWSWKWEGRAWGFFFISSNAPSFFAERESSIFSHIALLFDSVYAFFTGVCNQREQQSFPGLSHGNQIVYSRRNMTNGFERRMSNPKNTLTHQFDMGIRVAFTPTRNDQKDSLTSNPFANHAKPRYCFYNPLITKELWLVLTWSYE